MLARADTRNWPATGWSTNVPAGTKVVVEPVVPDAWASDIGRASRVTGNGARWSKWPTSRSQVNDDGTLAQGGLGPVVKLEDYERTLFPEPRRAIRAPRLLLVVTGSTQCGRA